MWKSWVRVETGSSPFRRSEDEVGDILKVTPLGTVSLEYRALISVPNKWVANPKLQDCLWKMAIKSSGITSRLVSKILKSSSRKHSWR